MKIGINLKIMGEFKILTRAVEPFKEINNGEDKYNLGLHKVELYEEHKFMDYTIFKFDDIHDNRLALEHARICVYEQLLTEI